MEQQTTQISLDGIKFTIGMPVYGNMPVYTATSLINSFRAFDAHGVDLSYVVEINCSLVDFARNNVVKQFLDLPGPSQKLIFIDSDIVWEPEDLLRLCCWSTKFPVVAAFYSTKIEGDQKILGDYWKGGDPGLTFNEYGLVRMTGLGMGFCIIDRSVFETLMPTTEFYNDKKNGPTYRFFATTTHENQPMGEDIYFFKRWCNAGGEVWVDPTIKLGHIGFKEYRVDPIPALQTYHLKLLEGN